MEVIPATDPRAESSEAPTIIVNVHTGQLKEIPCGPKDAAYVSGDRLVVWDRHRHRPIVPARHDKTWRLYVEFCGDSKIAKKHGLTIAESKAYFDAYVEWITNERGLGAKARHVHGAKPEDIEALWHPECLELRQAAKSSGRQRRVSGAGLKSITDKLTKRK